MYPFLPYMHDLLHKLQLRNFENESNLIDRMAVQRCSREVSM